MYQGEERRHAGGMEATVGRHAAQIERLLSDVTEINEKLDRLISAMAEAKGGWKVAVGLGGAAAALGATLASVWQYIKP
jgi:hypothetical protein